MKSILQNHTFVSKNFWCLFIISLIIQNHSALPQVIHDTKVSELSNGIRISFFSNSEDYIKGSNNENYFDYKPSVDLSSPGKPVLPSQTIIIAIPPESKISVNAKQFSEKIYQNSRINISPKVVMNEDTTFSYKNMELSKDYLVNESFPSEQVEVLDYFWLRDFYCVAIKINPVQFYWKNKSLKFISNGSFDIVFSDYKPFQQSTSSLGKFDEGLKNIIVNYSDAQKYRVNVKYNIKQDSSANWIDYTKTYYKLAIIKDGIYRITYDNLFTYGILPNSINPKTLKVYRQGKQIPLYVKGEDDFVFDQGDYIEFFSEKNYNKKDYRQIVAQRQDYINYMDRYNDTAFVWLTFGGDDGERITRQNSTPTSNLDTLQTYLNKQHFESDVRLWYYGAEDPRTQLPFWQEHKVFTWLLLGNSGSQDITFKANDFVPNTNVKTYARLISNSGDVIINCHKHGASLNSTVPEDTITFNFLETVNFVSTFNSSKLVEGNNIYRLFGLPSAASFDRSLVDWVDIEYLRQTKALNDSILITIPDGYNLGQKNIKITNLTTPDSLILVYKIGSDYKKIESFSYNNGNLVFSDTLKSGDKYLITKQDYNLTLEFRYSTGFNNLRDISRGADYIIITHKSLNQSTQEYKQFIESNYNLRVQRVFIDDIYDEFSFGQNWAESIKNFLIHTKDNWVQPSPSYVVLIGDANYDYKNIWSPAPSPRKKNLVPSYGYPVSDQWYTMWDTTNVNLPQIYVGRIPANNDNEVKTYLTKHEKYVNRKFDDWNKRYLLFSGGDPTKISELNVIKSTNDQVMNSYIKPAPVGGNVTHFYKTINPETNFGPYSLQQVQNTIDSSGLFISYLGHSGTRTWDNGITEVEDIKSSFQNRNPLISDFGCSTGKFAEPDVDSFGELFVCQSIHGEAVAYLGNSSLGFFSSSLGFPALFYKRILIDSVYSLCKVHNLSKIELMNLYGYSDVNKVFNYCNVLIADPVLELAVPKKPNFVVNQGSIKGIDQSSNDEDSVNVSVKVWNWGTVVSDSVNMIVKNIFNGNTTFIDTIKFPCPYFEGTINLKVNTNKEIGLHHLIITLDPGNKIDEIYEDDNSLDYVYAVYSTELRPIVVSKYYSSLIDTLKILNPINEPQGNVNELILSLGQDEEFENSIEYTIPFGTVVTRFKLISLAPAKRYWYKTRLNNSDIKWSSSYSFNNVINNYEFYIDKDFDSVSVILNNTAFDSIDNSWKLDETKSEFKVSSAGSNDGKFASMLFNYVEKLPNTFFWGMVSAEIDSITFEPYNIKYYKYPNTIAENADSLINYINSLPPGKLLALTICDDAAQTVLGFSGGTAVRRAIETLGSYYIDSVRYRESWCMIGKKGAPIGSVQESYKKLFEGFASVSSQRSHMATEGTITFPLAGKSSKWQSLTINDSLPVGSDIKIIPLALNNNNQIDTLNEVILNNGMGSLSDIDAKKYSQIYFQVSLSANELHQSPKITSLGIHFTPVAELATNYQAVKIEQDTIVGGTAAKLDFDIFNLGYCDADSFYVNVKVLNENNFVDTSASIFINKLRMNESKNVKFDYLSNNLQGKKIFYIAIDSENKIDEYFKDNNFFAKYFYVKSDAIPPTLKITFDEKEIINGDFVSSNPYIKIKVSDDSAIPITDPKLIKVYLNNEEVNQHQLNDSLFSVSQTLIYKPNLSDGDYLLTVVANDNSLNKSTSEVYFVVSSETKLLQVYNYPNPFQNETYFTFRLSQIPDEVKIRIYTIAGRMIKEIIKKSSELNYDLNRIYWNGRDEDGDVIANGTYLYKVLLKNGDKVESVNQKLVIVK